MSLWSVDLLREQEVLSAAAAAADLGALTNGTFVERAFDAGISRAIPVQLLLKISGVVCVTAFGATAIEAGPCVLGALAKQMPIHQAFLLVPSCCRCLWAS